MTDLPVLHIEHLSCSTPGGALLLKDINLSLAAGQKIVISGPSGSGKSVFSYSVAGLLPLMSDLKLSGNLQVAVNDSTLLEVTTLPKRKRALLFKEGVSVIFQDAQSALDDNIQVKSFFQDVYAARDKSFNSELTAQLLSELGFREPQITLSKYPYELSGGERQRIVIAAGLISTPRVLIADEATASLDSDTEQQTIKTIYDFCNRNNIALIFITHEVFILDQLSFTGFYSIQDKTLIEDTPSIVPWPLKEESTKSNQVLLSAHNISVEYGQAYQWNKTTKRKILDQVSLTINKSEIVGIYGPSGAGKSSLAQAMAGLIPIADGELILNGRPIHNLNPYQVHPLRDTVIYIPQDAFGSFHPYYSISKQLSWVDRTYTAQEVLMNQLAIDTQWFSLKPHQLSGGQRQRLMLFRALLKRPQLLICDEVTSGLDLELRKQILDTLSSLRTSHGISILFISHDKISIRYLCDRLIEIGR